MSRARAALLVLVSALVASCADGASGESGELDFAGSSVLLISIDTLRADRLGCHGYERGLTPNIDAFAEEAVLFEDMYANSPKTASSHMSLFTSMLPTVHKVRNQSARLGLVSPILAKNRVTLSQVLNRNGYWNAAVAGGGNLYGPMGFERGFAGRFESGLEEIKKTINRTLRRFRELEEADQPGFVFMHTYQVHGPYLPPREFMERYAPTPPPTLAKRINAYRDLPFSQQWAAMNRRIGNVSAFWEGKQAFGPEEAAYLSDLYDGEIAYLDSELGRLFDTLRERGLFDDMIVVLLSDHGEEFFEHGDFEHDQLFREHLHVPCLSRLPGARLGGTRVAGMTSLIDVMPTLLELLELEGPPFMQGQSQVPAMRSGRTPGLPVLAERVMFPEDYRASLRSERSAITFHAKESRLYAYDLLADPAELNDVIDQAGFVPQAEPALYQGLQNLFLLRDQLDAVDAGGELTLDSQERLEELAGLGYTGAAPGSEDIGDGTPLERWPERRGD